ncbi:MULTISPECIES: methyltransferase domain-containing protein [unclassified Streptomyces]|uniref:trifunctional class I SAM-dependent methyltransferase/NUDIX hydrolase/VOC family protein n=1 Tax=unclassified Streptomyces TaxID=2593676 RepID=UPI0033C43533
MAATFDEEPDHGLRDEAVRRAWADRLRDWLPEASVDVLDLGCGTGSLALLAAGRGHRVTGVDLSPNMLERARAKLASYDAEFLVGDVREPPVGGRKFDVVLARHVLWMMPDPEATLRDWCAFLRPGGRLILIEGVWGTESPAGLPMSRLVAALTPLAFHLHTERLSGDAELWGRRVEDERYAVVGTLPRTPARHAEIVDVHLMLRHGDAVLLFRRTGTGYADGLLHLPSGHVEPGEDVRTAMIREAHEELGIDLTPADLRAELILQHRGPGETPRTGWFFSARYGAGGTPRNTEPDKCAELSWHPLSALPHDMVAYCHAALTACHSGEHFALHWQSDEEGVAYDDGGTGTGAEPLAAARTGGIHHVELWVPDLEAAQAAWGWLLEELGHLPYQRWAHGRSWRRDGAYVVLEQSPALRSGGHDRHRPGLNHLAFHVRGRAELDRLVAAAPGHGWSLLYPDRHPHAGGEDQYAAYLEDAWGYEVELVAE